MSRLVTIKRNLDDQSRIAGSGILIPEAWKSLTPFLASGWVNFDVAGFNNPQYRKDPFGKVSLRGGMKQTVPAAVAQSAVLATLPAGYRPLNAVTVPLVSIDGSSVVGVGAVLIQPNGQVLAYSTTLHGTYVGLDGISFEAAA